MRLHDCSCIKCRVYLTGNEADGLPPCPHAEGWPFKTREVDRQQASGIVASRKSLNEKGRQLAANLAVSDIMIMAVQHVTAHGRRGDASRDLYWLGVVVDQGNL